ncbi:serine hydrolase domain-containing protein [Caulobacter sp. 17J65-9]|uniref:serine hydrolase domain-containing protein n=1 Tax=Caulobacter sp. 17J65-9 TaxID=2709382 RepID=UPI0013CAD805|nr:serine hydrolase domain-containing protein [Caulobacter sp. 17J65-9]NEX93086.1 beta-lactamase family protein [Caulobacter sp. 17J65-9]
MIRIALAAAVALAASSASAAVPAKRAAQIDAAVARAMTATRAEGLALAVIEDGQVAYVKSYGKRNAAGAPLEPQTVMYGASLTKAVFAYTVMQLAEEGVIDLDASIATYLDKPLTDYPNEDKYGPWRDLAGDERWRALTPRILLSHGSGFANFAFLEPDEKLRFHFDPGSRYAYSGEGLILLQFVLERGLGLDVGREMQRRVFDRFGMTDTSMIWRPDFASNLADGWDLQGKTEPHDERGRVRAAGSMDTTIADFARFAAGYVRGEGLSPKGRAELVRPQRPITTASQFPTLQPELPPAERRADLAAGLGLVVFDGPQGPGFFKTGHNDTTGNVWMCVERGRRCVVMLANDVRAEAAFPALAKLVLGETGAPWKWEYGDLTFWDGR